jgi:putative phosphoesterase
MTKMLIVSDLHANWAALQAVLAAEPDFDLAVCCGDIVDYGPRPIECLEWVRWHCTHVVRGNHDHAMAFNVDCRCMGSCRPYSVATRAWHRGLISDEQRDYLSFLPRTETFVWEGRRFCMAHATPQGDLYEYLTPEQWKDHLTGIEADYLLLGHTHVQGMRSFGNLMVVNPGSVGLARDTPGQACYAVYERRAIVLKRAAYRVEKTLEDLRAAPLPKDVIAGLTTMLRPQPSAEIRIAPWPEHVL